MARPRWQGSLAPRVRSRTRGQPSTMQPIDQHDESPIRTAQTDSPAVPAASSTPAVRTSATAVAPEVAARIVADCAAGVALSEITGRLHVTPGEALAVLAAVGRGAVGDACRCSRGRRAGGRVWPGGGDGVAGDRRCAGVRFGAARLFCPAGVTRRHGPTL